MSMLLWVTEQKKKEAYIQKNMNCSHKNDKIAFCFDCLKTNVPDLLECKCDNSMQIVFLKDKACDIVTFSSFHPFHRQLEEPLTVLDWDDPWMLASYILFGLLALISVIKLSSQCITCKYIRFS